MDLGAYWQENKRFVVGVGAGTLLFLVGLAVESSLWEGERNETRRRIQGLRNKLAEASYGADDLAQAERENAALRAAVERLGAAATFEPRAEFARSAQGASASNQYLRAISRVREELESRANRAGIEIDPKLGMPELSPTVEAEIERYLEALDLVETVLDLAIRARVERVDKIQVRLDPGLSSRQGLGRIERTRVSFHLTGSSLALDRLLVWSQRPPAGARPLLVDGFEMQNARGKEGEVRLEVTFVVPRMRAPEPVPEG
jgi:hypothetical protein